MVLVGTASSHREDKQYIDSNYDTVLLLFCVTYHGLSVSYQCLSYLIEANAPLELFRFHADNGRVPLIVAPISCHTSSSRFMKHILERQNCANEF